MAYNHSNKAIGSFGELMVSTVNFLNIRTPKTFVLIILKFELCGATIE